MWPTAVFEAGYVVEAVELLDIGAERSAHD